VGEIVKEENRSFSNMIQRIIIEWLEVVHKRKEED